jgi:hypothetical protein
MEYNTSRNKLLMPEYGRNIQKMVDYILTIEDRELRQKNANAIIELMGVLNPHLKNVEDFRHKLWDHIFRISDFKIDIDSPYPIPNAAEMFKKPEPLPYPRKNLKNRHIGKNISQIISKAMENEEESKKKGYINTIAYYMKLSYANWHKEQVQDDVIREELKSLSHGKLEYTPGDTRAPRFNNNNNASSTHKKHAQNNQKRNKGNQNNQQGGQQHKNRNSNNGGFQSKHQGNNNNRNFTQKNG